MSVPAHHATTRHLGAVYPFAAEPGLGVGHVIVGRDLLGGVFAYDPFALYRVGVLTNPNMLVVGQIGRGKSAFVKTYLWRMAAFGHRAWVVDPKGEYRALARAWGVEPITLRPGGSVRLNPLDAARAVSGGTAIRSPSSASDDVDRRRAELLSSLASASLGRVLLPTERSAVDVAVTHVSQTLVSSAAPHASALSSRDERCRAPTVPAVVEALMQPTKESARALHTDIGTLTAEGRQVALELRRLVAGDLRGMFDGPTSPGIRLDASLVVLDLSAVYHTAALGVLMTCAAAWLHAVLAQSADVRPSARGALVVVDEAWAILANLAVARWLQSSWKLSRSWGVANVAVLHRLSDLDSAGRAGSEQVELAHGLLADSETRVVYAQPPDEVDRAAAMLGLTSTEAEVVPQLQRGVALWKVGARSCLVQHRLSPYEEPIVDTDARMGGSLPGHPKASDPS